MAHQNVFWTLLAGLLTMAAVRQCRERLKSQVFGGLVQRRSCGGGMTAPDCCIRTMDTAVFFLIVVLVFAARGQEPAVYPVPALFLALLFHQRAAGTAQPGECSGQPEG